MAVIEAYRGLDPVSIGDITQLIAKRIRAVTGSNLMHINSKKRVLRVVVHVLASTCSQNRHY